MTIYIALLRGINVSGHRIIKMADLKGMFESLGLSNVKTYIQSGNVVFTSDEDADDLSKRLEQEIDAVFGFDVPVVIRTAEELEQIMLACPFEVDSLPEKERPYTALLSATPSPEGIEQLLAVPVITEEFRVIDREVYILYGQAVHKSKLTNNLLEKKLGVAATTRNWQTMSKLTEIARAMREDKVEN